MMSPSAGDGLTLASKQTSTSGFEITLSLAHVRAAWGPQKYACPTAIHDPT